MSDSSAFVAPASIPVREAPHGIRFDFNHGARVHLPPGDWQVRLSDARTHNTLFDTRLAEGWVTSSKRYFVPFRIEVWQAGQLVFTHRLDLDRTYWCSFRSVRSETCWAGFLMPRVLPASTVAG